MNPDLLHVLQHALGLDQYGRVCNSSGEPVRRWRGEKTYRNHYVTEEGDSQCRELMAMGFMIRHAPREISGGDPIYTVTEAGKAAVIEHSPLPRKVNRGAAVYQEWLRFSDAYDIKFGEYLKRRKEIRAWMERGAD